MICCAQQSSKSTCPTSLYCLEHIWSSPLAPLTKKIQKDPHVRWTVLNSSKIPHWLHTWLHLSDPLMPPATCPLCQSHGKIGWLHPHSPMDHTKTPSNCSFCRRSSSQDALEAKMPKTAYKHKKHSASQGIYKRTASSEFKKQGIKNKQSIHIIQTPSQEKAHILEGIYCVSNKESNSARRLISPKHIGPFPCSLDLFLWQSWAPRRHLKRKCLQLMFSRFLTLQNVSNKLQKRQHSTEGCTVWHLVVLFGNLLAISPYWVESHIVRMGWVSNMVCVAWVARSQFSSLGAYRCLTSTFRV